MKKLNLILAAFVLALIGFTTSCNEELETVVHVESIEITAPADEAITMKVGETQTLTVVVAPENAANKNFSTVSSYAAVVSVDEANLVIKAEKEGTATITVTTLEKDYTFTDAITVTVVKDEEPEPTTYDWYMVGSFNEWTVADANYGMAKEGEWYVLKGFTAEEGTEAKFNAGSWDVNRGGDFTAVNEAIAVAHNGNNIIVPAGTYDVYLCADEAVDYAFFMTPGEVPTHPSEQPAEPMTFTITAEYGNYEGIECWIGTVVPSDAERYYIPGYISQAILDSYADEGALTDATIEAFAQYQSDMIKMMATDYEMPIAEVVAIILEDSGAKGTVQIPTDVMPGKNYFVAFTFDANGDVEGLNYLMFHEETSGLPQEITFTSAKVKGINSNWSFTFDGTYYINVPQNDPTTIVGEYDINADMTMKGELEADAAEAGVMTITQNEDGTYVVSAEILYVDGAHHLYSYEGEIEGAPVAGPDVEETMFIDVVGTTANNITVNVTYPEGTESFVLRWVLDYQFEYYYCTNGVVDMAKVLEMETEHFNGIIAEELEKYGSEITLAQALNWYGYGNGYQTEYNLLAYDTRLWDNSKYYVFAYTASVDGDGNLVITSNVACEEATTAAAELLEDFEIDIEMTGEVEEYGGISAYFKLTPNDLNQRYYFNIISGYDKENQFAKMEYEEIITSMISMNFNFGGLDQFLNYSCYTGVYDPTTAEWPYSAYISPDDPDTHEHYVFAAAISDKGEIISEVSVYEYAYVAGGLELKDVYTIEIDEAATTANNVVVNTTVLDETFADKYYMVYAGLKSEIENMTDEEILAKDIERIENEGYDLASYFEWYVMGNGDMTGASLLNPGYYAEPGSEVVAYAYLADAKNGGRLLTKVARSESFTTPEVTPIDMTFDISFASVENSWQNYYYAYFNIIPSDDNNKYFVGGLSKSEAEDLFAGLEGQELAQAWYKKYVGQNLTWGAEGFVEYSCFTGPLYQAESDNFWNPIMINSDYPDMYEWYYFAVAVDPTTGHYASDFAIYEYTFELPAAPLTFDIQVVESNGAYTATFTPSDLEAYYLPFAISDLELQAYVNDYGMLTEPTIEALAKFYIDMIAQSAEPGMTGQEVMAAFEAAQGVQELQASPVLGKNYFFAFTMDDNFEVASLTVVMYKEVKEEGDQPGETDYDIEFAATECTVDDWNGDGSEYVLYLYIGDDATPQVSLDLFPETPGQGIGSYAIGDGSMYDSFTYYIDDAGDSGNWDTFMFDSLNIEITSEGLEGYGVLDDGRTIHITYNSPISFY